MFNVLLADCPWKYSNLKTGGNHISGASQKYPTMSLEEICNLDISKIAEPDSILFLWITNPLLFSHAPKVLDAWDYKFRSIITWEKLGRLGMGFWLRNNTEQLIVATKGNIKPFRMSDKNIISVKRLGHSEKPEEFRKLIDKISDKVFGSCAQKLEMFARKQVENWSCWGLDLDGKTIQQKIEEYCIQNQETNIIRDEVIDVG